MIRGVHNLMLSDQITPSRDNVLLRGMGEDGIGSQQGEWAGQDKQTPLKRPRVLNLILKT